MIRGLEPLHEGKLRELSLFGLEMRWYPRDLAVLKGRTHLRRASVNVGSHFPRHYPDVWQNMCFAQMSVCRRIESTVVTAQCNAGSY